MTMVSTDVLVIPVVMSTNTSALSTALPTVLVDVATANIIFLPMSTIMGAVPVAMITLSTTMKLTIAAAAVVGVDTITVARLKKMR